jgi:hypothetical protein
MIKTILALCWTRPPKPLSKIEVGRFHTQALRLRVPPASCTFSRPSVAPSPPPACSSLPRELREVRCRGELRPTTSSPPAAYRTPVLCRTLGGTLPALGRVRAPSTIVPVLLLASHARPRCAHVRRSRSVPFFSTSCCPSCPFTTSIPPLVRFAHDAHRRTNTYRGAAASYVYFRAVFPSTFPTLAPFSPGSL